MGIWSLVGVETGLGHLCRVRGKHLKILELELQFKKEEAGVKCMLGSLFICAPFLYIFICVHDL